MIEKMKKSSLRARWVFCASLLSLLAGAHSTVHAETLIRSIKASAVSGVELAVIELNDGAFADPVSFSTQTPARIALDFNGVSSSIDRGDLQFALQNMRSANVVQANGRTRVIFNLKESVGFEVKRSHNRVEIALKDPAVALSRGAPAAEPTGLAAAAFLQDIDFRRGGDGAGRLIVSLPVHQTAADITTRGRSLVIELPNVRLPDSLRKRLNVTDFGTPVDTVVAESSAVGTRITVNPRGNWEHSAYQTDGRLVVDVKEVKADPSKLTQGPGFVGDKLSLNFQNIEIRALLQVIADFTNFNIVTSDSVTGAVTLRLKDVPWDQALEIIMQAKSLGMKKNGNVIWIAPKDEIAARDKADLESKVSLEGLETLRTQAFQLNYAKAGDIATQLGAGNAGGQSSSGGTAATGILSSRGGVIAEPRTNQIFVTDVPSRLQQVEALIAKLDIPVRQVLIEARIVEADDKVGRSLGARLGGADLRGVRGGDAGYDLVGGNRVAFGGTYDAVNATTGAFDPAALTTASSTFFNLPASGLGGVSPASCAISLFKPSANRFLNLEISALEADSRGKIVSSPRLVTADQVKAIIEQGVEFPYQTTAPNGGTTISFKKASLKLEVTPQITPEGAIILDVEVNKDSPGEILSGARAINTKRVQTQVLVENGGTVVIGGIFESNEAEAETKVPYLGDVPLLGNLFKTRSRSNNKTEMLVFITPKVIAEKAIVN